jgi:hypothetical protein
MTDIVDFTTRKRSAVKPPPDISAEAEIDNLVRMAFVVLNAAVWQFALTSAFASYGHAAAWALAGYVPRGDLSSCSKNDGCLAGVIIHSITRSTRSRTEGGMVRPRAFVLLRLITNSNLTGCSTGKSLGLVPEKILPT